MTTVTPREGAALQTDGPQFGRTFAMALVSGPLAERQSLAAAPADGEPAV